MTLTHTVTSRQVSPRCFPFLGKPATGLLSLGWVGARQNGPGAEVGPRGSSSMTPDPCSKIRQVTVDVTPFDQCFHGEGRKESTYPVDRVLRDHWRCRSSWIYLISFKNQTKVRTSFLLKAGWSPTWIIVPFVLAWYSNIILMHLFLW